MSYIRSKKVDLEEGQVSRDGAIHLELPDHDEAGGREALDLDMNLDDELLDFALGLLNQVNELMEGEALVVWKVVF